MNYINATVIISEDDQKLAQEDFPGSFISSFSDEDNKVFYICSGMWQDDILSRIVNKEFNWSSEVYYDDIQTVLSNLKLKPSEITLS